MKDQKIPSNIMFDNKTDEEKRLILIKYIKNLKNVNKFVPDTKEFLELGQGSFDYEIPITDRVISTAIEFISNLNLSDFNKLVCNSYRSLTIKDVEELKLKKYILQDSCWEFTFINEEIKDNSGIFYKELKYLTILTDDYGNFLRTMVI